MFQLSKEHRAALLVAMGSAVETRERAARILRQLDEDKDSGKKIDTYVYSAQQMDVYLLDEQIKLIQKAIVENEINF